MYISTVSIVTSDINGLTSLSFYGFGWAPLDYSSNPTNYNTLIVQLTHKLQLFPTTKPSVL